MKRNQNLITDVLWREILRSSNSVGRESKLLLSKLLTWLTWSALAQANRVMDTNGSGPLFLQITTWPNSKTCSQPRKLHAMQCNAWSFYTTILPRTLWLMEKFTIYNLWCVSLLLYFFSLLSLWAESIDTIEIDYEIFSNNTKFKVKKRSTSIYSVCLLFRWHRLERKSKVGSDDLLG